MEVKVFCNTPEEVLFGNVKANGALDLPWIETLDAHDGHAVIVGGGPSVRDQIEEIRWRQSLGQKVFALNNAARYLASHDILADYQVILDARESNVDFVGYAKHFLIASQCHPSLALKAKDLGETSIWHPLIPGLGDHLPKKGDGWTSIGGGTTVGLCTMALAFAMGYRKLHLYGYDSCFHGDEAHAYEQARTAKESIPIATWVAGKKYLSPITMAKQAEFWPALAEELANSGCVITVHGEGLIQSIARQMEQGWPEVGTLNAVYDLAVSPPTFDFLSFLCGAEEARQKWRMKDIHVTFQPGPNGGFRDDNLPPDVETRKAMLWNVCVAACRLLPTVSGVTVLTQRQPVQEPLYPQGWHPEKPLARYGMMLVKQGLPRALKAPESAKRTVAKAVHGRYMTITERNTEYWPERNSDKKAWQAVAWEIAKRGYEVITVPDTSDAIKTSGIGALAASDLCIRQALYEGAACNLMVSNGPAILPVLSEAPYLIFKPIVPSCPSATVEFLAKHGFNPGDQYGPNGVLVWEDDKAVTIIEELKKFMDGERPNPLNTPVNVMLEQAEAGLNRKVPMFLAGKPHDQTALIVGGGPSLPEMLPKLRFHKQRGGKIFALNGTHDWLIERGIVPDFHILLDARKENVRFVAKPHKDVTYLLAAQCHEDLYQALDGYNVVQYVAWCPGIEELAKRFPKKPISVIGGGETVGLKAMLLAHLMGFRKLHLFGMDSCYRGEHGHAYKQDLNDNDRVIDVEYNGEKFKAAIWMARQAEQFPDQYGKLVQEGSRITIHGEGLLKTILESLQPEKEAA